MPLHPSHPPHPFLRSHLTLAHHFWETIVIPGDTVIDATCGNGHDTLCLAKLALTEDSGTVFAFDIQSKAIEKTKLLLQTNLSKDLTNRISLLQSSHKSFPKEILPKSVKLIAYNLGYLPGGDKKLTTMAESTLESLHSALKLISPEGMISITCYPGHSQGKIEEDAIIKYAASLDPRAWNCIHHRWINRPQSPNLMLICHCSQQSASC